MLMTTALGCPIAPAGLSSRPRRAARGGTISDDRLSGLMVAAQSGDGQAYAAMLRECIPIIRAVVLANGVRATAAEDVVQDVLLALHRARHTYDPAHPFLPWLRTIAQRRAIDMLRLTGRRGDRELHAPSAYDEHPDPAPPAWQAISRDDDGARLRAAVATLPDGQRQAVELLGLRELSLEEASSLTGRTKTALKVNLHRALRALRLRLPPQTDDDD